MAKYLAAAVAALSLGGCTTATMQPHSLVTKMSADHPKYATDECRQARAMALAYDDNTAGRMGLGLGLGLLLGPFGLPLAIAADASQGSKRAAVVSELTKACYTPEEAAKLRPPEPQGERPRPSRSMEASQPDMR